MIEEKSGPRSSVCLQILVHGIFGDSMEWDYFSSKSNEMFELVRNENQLFILKSKTNSSFKSLAGLDKLGKRLAVEIIDFIKNSILTHYSNVDIHLSFIGHSLGGLVARYTIGLLFADNIEWKQFHLDTIFDNKSIRILPSSYISVSTPHLGSRRCVDSSNATSFFIKHILDVYLKNLAGPTGRELGLFDNNWSNTNENTKLLHDLAKNESYFAKAIQLFKFRTLIGHRQDMIVAYSSATVRSVNPFSNSIKEGFHICGYSGFNKDDYPNDLFDTLFSKNEFNTDYEEVDPPGTNHHMYEPLHNGTEKIQNNSKDFFSLHRIKSLRSKSASPKKSNNNTSEPVRNETEKIENNPIDFFSLHRNKSNRSKSMSPKKSIQSSDIDNLTEYDTDPGISFQSRSRFRERGPELTLEMASVNKKVMNDEKVDSAVLVGETSNLQRSYTSPSPKQNIVYYSDNTCELEFTKDMICELQKIQWRRISLDYGLSFPHKLFVHEVLIGKYNPIVPSSVSRLGMLSAEFIAKLSVADLSVSITQSNNKINS